MTDDLDLSLDFALDLGEPSNISVEAATHVNHLAVMTALRRNIAAAIDDGVAARDLAALSRRLIEIDREIRHLSHKEEDPIDDALGLSD